ncbi:MAG: acetyl-CoA synthetase [Clostridiales bacterium]|nr:acetyl-CoA synthetase [Clostridiales bacterium]
MNRYCPRIEFDSYEDFKKNFVINVPENFNFAYDIVDTYAIEEPERQALVWCNDEYSVKRFTFADIKRLSDKTANFLVSAGIGKGDKVMLMLKQRPEIWVTLMALCKIGAVAIPASFQLKSHDITYRCDAADVKMIICVDDGDICDNVYEALGEAKTLKSLAVLFDNEANLRPAGIPVYDFGKCVDEADENWVRPENYACGEDMMLLYFSSGTTGMPKMVEHDFTYPLGHITTAYYWQRVIDGGVHLTQSDSGWAKFAWGKIFGQWVCGSAIAAYDTEKFDPAHMIMAIKALEPTTFCAPATIYRFLIKEDMKPRDFASVKHACVAGEALNPEVFNKFYSLTGLKVADGFGQTETTVLIANFKWFDIRPGSVGKPSPLYDLEVVDEDGERCEDGMVGNIVIRNAKGSNKPVGLFKGYYINDDANAAAFNGSVYNTGDMGWRDGDGYIWFTGRNDDVIKCSGYRIGPFEVESALHTHPSVLECAVTAVPDPVRGQVVKATIVLSKGYVASDALTKELQQHVKMVTAPYKYPRIIEYVKELPKTTSGKIKRSDIRNADVKKEWKK